MQRSKTFYIFFKTIGSFAFILRSIRQMREERYSHDPEGRLPEQEENRVRICPISSIIITKAGFIVINMVAHNIFIQYNNQQRLQKGDTNEQDH